MSSERRLPSTGQSRRQLEVLNVDGAVFFIVLELSFRITLFILGMQLANYSYARFDIVNIRIIILTFTFIYNIHITFINMRVHHCNWMNSNWSSSWMESTPTAYYI